MRKKVFITAITLIGLFIVFNLLNQIFNALKSEERLSLATETLHKLEIENKQLKQRLGEISSREFIEEQARNKLSLGKKGETVVIIPEEKIKQALGSTESTQPKRLPNWLGWLRVFWH
ncbi:hypothetical protein A3B45_04130 [Candidatus Daviesbacteria bacterium RIFCSPLOWO2_01_FULL_39_12]|uniref:Cell division protein FtsL n=1 Tax=Candidatus Daviesbacteria bacterium RIFCSPLOWO2_01_FULL_39_12 TaxID=1797785 RepID=A0A1F5KU09_9BACT|nr:MAG: hypothetical protein A3B45_04130 [Candidatus Daviesbacteria bacterium RIFCSPLOWO2_01_FULL_39_12]